MGASYDCSRLPGSYPGRRQASGAVSGSDHRPMVRPDAVLYAELHCHSAYSFLDGASPPDGLLGEAHRLGYTAVRRTHRNGTYRSVALAHAARPLRPLASTARAFSPRDGSHVVFV